MITDEELAEGMQRAYSKCPEGWGLSWVAAARKARELLCPVLQPAVEVGSYWASARFPEEGTLYIRSLTTTPGGGLIALVYGGPWSIALDSEGRPVYAGWYQVAPAPKSTPKSKDHWRKVRVGQVWQWADIECDTVVRIGKDPSSYYKATMALGGAILLQTNDGTPEYPQWTLVYDPRDDA